MVIDFHSHILPRLDDGSRSVEESLAMLQLSRAQGVEEIILTPHFYPQQHNPEHFLAQRRQSLEQLCSAIGPEMAVPALRLGAEVYYYPHMSHSAVLEQLAIEEEDESFLEDILTAVEDIKAKEEKMRIEVLLSGEYDANNAILSFHPGAGGTEAQDWALMLYRMYTRWGEKNGFNVKLIDWLDGEEAGLKSATIMVEGLNAYG